MATKGNPTNEKNSFNESPPFPESTNDPLSELLKEQSNDDNEEDSEDIPEEISQLFEEYGIDEKKYSCMLKEIPEGTDDINKAQYIKSFTQSYPSVEALTKEYGPGHYVLYFSWRAHTNPITGETKKNATIQKIKPIHVIVSSKLQDIYDDYQSERRLQRRLKQQKLTNEAREKVKIENMMNGIINDSPEQPHDTIDAAKSYIKSIVEANQMLGLAPKVGPDWGDILKSVMPFIPPLLAFMSQKNSSDQSRSDKLLALLLDQGNKNNTQLLEVMKTVQGPTNGASYMKEVKDMIFAAVDIKRELAPEKEGVIDKIFSLIEGIAPTIIEVAKMNSVQRNASIPYNMAKAYVSTAPEFKALSNDPEMLSALVTKLDSFYGTEQTDQILQVAGYTRPAQCMENYKTMPKVPVQSSNEAIIEE